MPAGVSLLVRRIRRSLVDRDCVAVSTGTDRVSRDVHVPAEELLELPVLAWTAAAMLVAYEADPELAAMRLDFSATLREVLEV